MYLRILSSYESLKIFILFVETEGDKGDIKFENMKASDDDLLWRHHHDDRDIVKRSEQTLENIRSTYKQIVGNENHDDHQFCIN